ncbi:MAG: type II toxin-antitoxin system VapC family toxin [Gemmatimonadetes bacterium]|nr:type II toxin-antitoxin system VapC family toxin [Gemmatimonadota bacterium]
MIVVDTNVIAYLLLPSEHTPAARAAYERDPIWAAPLLWRSEFRNVLATSIHQGHMTLDDAVDVMDVGNELMEGREYAVDSADVLNLASLSSCSAYDCEFVALARELAVPLLTEDRRIRTSFRDLAVRLVDFGRYGS